MKFHTSKNNYYLLISAIFLTVSGIFSNKVICQTLDFCGTFPFHQASSSNPDSIWFDRFGNSYDIAEESEIGLGATRELCGYYEITYFNNVPSLFQGRICDVFEDLSEILDQRVNISICGDTILASPVKIRIAMSTLDTGILGAGTATLYKNDGPFGCHEIAQNKVYDKINGGRIDNPLDIDYDGRIILTNNTAHKFYAGTEITPNGQYDLYSIVLHEAGHLLGFYSFIDTNGIDDVISLWDK